MSQIAKIKNVTTGWKTESDHRLFRTSVRIAIIVCEQEVAISKEVET
jgi:hypothetical protein